jgi:hypothetical protein
VFIAVQMISVVNAQNFIIGMEADVLQVQVFYVQMEQVVLYQLIA